MTFKTRPYAHQQAAFDRLTRSGCSIGPVLMEQGTGKSKVAIDVASELFSRGEINAVLLIAPNGVQRQWAREQIPVHSPVPTRIWIWTTSSARLRAARQEDFLTDEEPGRLKWFCANVDVFSTSRHVRVFKEFLLNHQAMVVVDEATRIKNPGANRTINVLYNLGRVVREGRRVVRVEPYSRYRMILTGLIVTNSPYDLWAMFEFLRHDYFGCNYFAFRARYGLEMRDTHPGTGRTYTRAIRPDEMRSIRRYSEEGKSVETIAAIMATTESNVQFVLDNPGVSSPYKHLDELREKIRVDSIIVRKQDCLDLPPKTYERLEVELNSEQRRVYRDLVREFMAQYEGRELTVQNKISLVGRLLQVTGGFFPYVDSDGRSKVSQITATCPKLEALADDLEETEEIVIVWAQFVAELRAIHSRLEKAFPGRRVALYYGGTPEERRGEIIEQFKRGEVDILVANPRTAGTGLNLQRSHFHYFYSNSFSLEDRLQAEDRSHRSGQTSTVLYKDVVATGTVDEKVHEVLAAKRDLLDYFRESSLRDLIGGE